MIYFIFAVIALMIAAPIIAILPNERQKMQLQKRKTAMAAGIRVELTHIDDPDLDPNKYLSNTGLPLPRRLSVIAYRKPLRRPGQAQTSKNLSASNWLYFRAPKALLDNTEGVGRRDWILGTDSDLPQEMESQIQFALSMLPMDVVQVEVNNFMLSVYWQEQGDAVEILSFLGSCAKLVEQT